MAGDVRARARATLRLARPTTANSSETQTPVPTSTFRPAINAPGRRARAGMPCLLQATTPQQRHHATAPRHAISVSAIYGGCSALHPNVIDVITYSGDATGRDGSARARRKGGRHAGSTENFPLSLSLSCNPESTSVSIKGKRVRRRRRKRKKETDRQVRQQPIDSYVLRDLEHAPLSPPLYSLHH